MKKIIAIFLIGGLCISLTACGTKKNSNLRNKVQNIVENNDTISNNIIEEDTIGYYEFNTKFNNLNNKYSPLLDSKIEDREMLTMAYREYDLLLNEIWATLKKQLSSDNYQTLLKEQMSWVNSKLKDCPTCDNTNWEYQDKYLATGLTVERINYLLNYCK